MPTTGYEHQIHHAHRTRAHSTVSIHNDDSSCGDLSVGYDFQRTNSMPNMSYDHHPHQRNSLTDNEEEEEEEEDANPEISQIKHERRVKAG
eukprot:CAMPEP_0202452448 /NCGR_PEP_ID=MMETSP1360-20130828/10663_1 /ASSEMBLY_ACC=CAM_ASM_000848 /TAXON_ID=515479 /ORGANISM="Licmophora paradoxa, Strain CCMP2313" /LENGTH=90 /DNA_ID=CAMNT_0049071279 /DNA_START=28 /DNA_END=296 /DNA_ORIENTATION=+